MLTHWFHVVVWSVLLAKTAQFCVSNVLFECERRPTEMLVRLQDPVLCHLPRRDWTVAINTLQHAMHLLFLPNIVYMLWHGHDTEWPVTALAFMLVASLRALCIFLTPLEIPHDHIHLEDTLQNLMTRRTRNYDRDLFFSGHVSILWLSGLTYWVWPERAWWFLAAAVVQAVLLLVTRVHYTVDVLVAPFMSYGCFHLAQRLVG